MIIDPFPLNSYADICTKTSGFCPWLKPSPLLHISNQAASAKLWYSTGTSLTEDFRTTMPFMSAHSPSSVGAPTFHLYSFANMSLHFAVSASAASTSTFTRQLLHHLGHETTAQLGFLTCSTPCPLLPTCSLKGNNASPLLKILNILKL